jgi:transglutaminase-like putative cysteine protease
LRDVGDNLGDRCLSWICPPPPGQEACDLCEYHSWAEFFVSGLGWIPADASCACRYGKGALFGDLELNHIAWSVGRDLLLAPRQRGGPLLFFAGPYAEVDGQPQTVERTIRFAEEQKFTGTPGPG